MMDTTNSKLRIRQCSECSGDLKYFCVTCSSELCLQCKGEHVLNNSEKDIHSVIIYREKSNYLKNHEICVRHPHNVYYNYCELCKLPICIDCTEHETHKQTDIGTAYEAKRQKREIIQKCQEEAFYCSLRFADIDLSFKTMFSDKTNINSDILTKSEKLTGCLDNVLHNFHLKHRCLKQKIKINKYIASTYIYEQDERSSDAPIQFLLSIKKHHFKCYKYFQTHGQKTITTLKSLKAETDTVIEKLLTVKLTNKRKRLEEIEEIKQHVNARIMKIARDPLSLIAFAKDIPKLLSLLPVNFAGEPQLAKFLDEIPSICEHASMHIADGTFRMPTEFKPFF